MARPVWSGTISFGLVAIPIKLYNAVRRQSVSFNQLDERNMARIRYRKVNAETGEEVTDDHIVKGYEVSKGRYVVVDPDELEPFMPVGHEVGRSRGVRRSLRDRSRLLRHGVPPRARRPTRSRTCCWPGRWRRAGKVAIGRFVMRNKQYTAAIRAEDGRLVMSTLAYADEVVDPSEIDELQGLDDVEVSAKEITMAESLVESLTADFEPEKYHDEYREQVMALIQHEGRRRGVRDARGGRREAEGHRHHGGARGQREGGEGRSLAASVRAELRQEVEQVGVEVGRQAAGQEGRGEEVRLSGAVVGSDPHMASPVVVEIDGRTVSLSNLDKVLYPSGFTKAEIVDYHARIAPTVIPHLAGRCLTFRRFPNGTDEKGFFEKRCPSHRPEWVPVALGPGDRSGGIEYCRIEEPAAMVWAANMAAIELHAPMALAADLATPRALVFDFDPGPRTSIVECCTVALGVRDVLEAVGSRGVVQDVGLEGAADVRAAEHRGCHARGRRRLRARRRPGDGTPDAGQGDDRDGQGRAPREGLRRLEPERAPQDHDRSVLVACPPRADGVDAGDVGRGRDVLRPTGSSCASRPATCWRASTSSATCSSRCSRPNNACPRPAEMPLR